MDTSTKQARRAVAGAELAAERGFSELGKPGVPVEPPQPKWPRAMPKRAVWLGTLAGTLDLYVVPREFPLNAAVIVVEGPLPQHVRQTDVKAAARGDYPPYELALCRAMFRGLVQPWELQRNNDYHEREQLFAELPWRGFRIPACADDLWDPEVHGVEVDDDNDNDDPVISWKPGRYSFSAHSGSDGNWDVSMPGERGGVPAAEPAQDVLRAMHVFIAELRDRL